MKVIALLRRPILHISSPKFKEHSLLPSGLGVVKAPLLVAPGYCTIPHSPPISPYTPSLSLYETAHLFLIGVGSSAS